jgi:hypothetical protein
MIFEVIHQLLGKTPLTLIGNGFLSQFNFYTLTINLNVFRLLQLKFELLNILLPNVILWKGL